MLLSKTWLQTWRSSPILDFHCRRSGSNGRQSFAAAAWKKFCRGRRGSRRPRLLATSVRILVRWETEECSAFLDDLLDLTARISPQAIDLAAESPNTDLLGLYDDPSFQPYCIPLKFFVPNRNQFRRLETLRLRDCNFLRLANVESAPLFACLGDSLKSLSLEHVRFPHDRILNSMIAGASALETLFLSEVRGVRRIRIRDHPNLKLVCTRRCFTEGFDVVACPCLESLTIDNSEYELWALQVSETPNLKLLNICGTSTLELNTFVSKFPSLETIFLSRLPRMDELKIVNGGNLREVTLSFVEKNILPPAVIEIDAPMLSNFTYSGYITPRFPKILIRNSGEVAVSASCYIKSEKNCWNEPQKFRELKQFVAELSQYRLTLELDGLPKNMIWDEDGDASPTPLIECLKFPSAHLTTRYEVGFLDRMFRVSHPKLLSFNDGYFDKLRNEELLQAMEFMCNRFAEKHSIWEWEVGCKCWRCQLKDVKMVSSIDRVSIREDEATEVSVDKLRSMSSKKDHTIWFIMNWH